MNNSNGGKRGGMLERWSGSDPDFGSRVILWIDVYLVLLSACQLENKTITRQATRSQRSGFEQTIADNQSWFAFLPSGHYVPLYHMYNKGEGQMSNSEFSVSHGWFVPGYCALLPTLTVRQMFIPCLPNTINILLAKQLLSSNHCDRHSEGLKGFVEHFMNFRQGGCSGANPPIN